MRFARPRVPKKPKRRAGTIIKLGTQRVAPDTVLRYVFNVQPKPKVRPKASLRNGKLVMHTDREYQQYEAGIKASTAIQHAQYSGMPYTGDLTVACTHYLPNRVHGDIDNLAKAILDGMQDVAFVNDKQVKRLLIELRFDDPENTRTEVLITPYVGSDNYDDGAPDDTGDGDAGAHQLGLDF